jgi:hypothetical protein
VEAGNVIEREMTSTRSDNKDNMIKIFVVCNQRPVCICPTIGGGSGKKAHFPLNVHRDCTVKLVKLSIQAQLNRNSQLNAKMLDPSVQILVDPEDGHEMQVIYLRALYSFSESSTNRHRIVRIKCLMGFEMDNKSR